MAVKVCIWHTTVHRAPARGGGWEGGTIAISVANMAELRRACREAGLNRPLPKDVFDSRADAGLAVVASAHPGRLVFRATDQGADPTPYLLDRVQ